MDRLIYYVYILYCYKVRSKLATGDISSGAFDKRDVERIEKDDVYAGCFLRTLRSKNDIPKALEVVNEAFTFRKAMGVWGE